MEGKGMDVDSDEEPRLRQLVMDAPLNPQLPQTNKYSLPQFYVRECYDQYYKQAFQLLQTYELISVTGTKGIKFIFLMFTDHFIGIGKHR
jgi:hypothetical protein